MSLTVGDISKAQELILEAADAIDQQAKILRSLKRSLEEYREYLEDQIEVLRDLSVKVEYDHE